MGGQQASDVLVTVKRDQLEAKGEKLSAEDEQKIRKPILKKYEDEGHPYYSTARLWDDGIIDPADTRNVLALAISTSLNKPFNDTAFGVFRM